MSTVKKVMQALKSKGSAQTRKIYMRHGSGGNSAGDMFGVKVADLKVIAKTIKGNQDLACELYEIPITVAAFEAYVVGGSSEEPRSRGG